MTSEMIFTNFLKFFFLVTSPVTFLVGIFLLFDVDTYMRIEKFLGKTITTPRKKLIKQLGRQRELMQMFLIRRRRVIGIICLLNSLVAIIFTNVMLMRK
ncbi:MAG: hypothetical protein V2A59_00585 [Candidatus Omnitrophota bacterium]